MAISLYIESPVIKNITEHTEQSAFQHTEQSTCNKIPVLIHLNQDHACDQIVALKEVLYQRVEPVLYSSKAKYKKLLKKKKQLILNPINLFRLLKTLRAQQKDQIDFNTIDGFFI